MMGRLLCFFGVHCWRRLQGCRYCWHCDAVQVRCVHDEGFTFWKDVTP
jgi:hypothetical protein